MSGNATPCVLCQRNTYPDPRTGLCARCTVMMRDPAFRDWYRDRLGSLPTSKPAPTRRLRT